MKTIYWKKIDVWCEYPFNQEIDYRYIEFHSKKRTNYKTKYPFTCDSQLVNQDRINFVAKQLGLNPKTIKLKKL